MRTHLWWIGLGILGFVDWLSTAVLFETLGPTFYEKNPLPALVHANFGIWGLWVMKYISTCLVCLVIDHVLHSPRKWDRRMAIAACGVCYASLIGVTLVHLKRWLIDLPSFT